MVDNIYVSEKLEYFHIIKYRLGQRDNKCLNFMLNYMKFSVKLMSNIFLYLYEYNFNNGLKN